MRLAKELLGAPTIGWGSAPAGVGGGESQRSRISSPSHLECINRHQDSWFPTPIDLIIAKNAIFHLKVLNKIDSHDVF
jgi:hypothetical protein